MITVSKLMVCVAGLLVCSLLFAQQDAQPQHMATVAAEKAEPTAPKVEAPSAGSKPTPKPLTEDQQLANPRIIGGHGAWLGADAQLFAVADRAGLCIDR